MSTNHTNGDTAWPPYSVSSNKYAQAVGILCINYNNLEAKLLELAMHFSNAPADIMAFSFVRLGNETRLDLLKRIFSDNVSDTSFKDYANYFARGFKACAENRNIVLHSQVTAVSTDHITIAKKRSKSGDESVYYFGLDIVRRVADEIFEWSRFGHLIVGHALYLERASEKTWPEDWTILGPRTLPEKPKLPESVIASHPSKLDDR